ncbi:MAG TPA: hypothetical protein VH560_15295, partial [Polyangia bacterium]|nr:hypothetical protein [Polyangia bacterium]
MPARVEANGGRWRIDLDLWVIAAWWLLVVALGFSRPDYTGDGLRHLPAIVDGTGFHLGEPRWLLFPGFLYTLLRPFVVLGLAPDVVSLIRFMTSATVLAGAAYMLALRACLVASGVDDVRRRAAALALAGSTAGIFLPSFDLSEPIFGAALVIMGLAWAARRANASGASPAERRRALIVSVATIATATLLYQGLVLAIGLLPLVIPRDTFRDRRALLISALILAAIPLVIVGALVAAGNSVPYAIGRAIHGEENEFYRTFLKKTGVSARVLPLIAGPPQGFVQHPDFHGFNGLIASLRGGVGRREAVETLASMGFTAAIAWL